MPCVVGQGRTLRERVCEEGHGMHDMTGQDRSIRLLGGGEDGRVTLILCRWDFDFWLPRREENPRKNRGKLQFPGEAQLELVLSSSDIWLPIRRAVGVMDWSRSVSVSLNRWIPAFPMRTRDPSGDLLARTRSPRFHNFPSNEVP